LSKLEWSPSSDVSGERSFSLPDNVEQTPKQISVQ